MHRHEWIRSKVSLEDTILEVGSAENPVWAGTPYKVTTLDKSVRPEEQCFPDVVAEAEDLPFEDQSFDIVCEGELLEHVPDPQKVLREAVRVARKKIIITVPFEHEWAPECKPFWNPGHIRFYTPETFRDEVNKLDLPFNIETVRVGPWVWLGAEVYCCKEANMEYPAELKQFFESERYWHGDWGYHQGYQDFPIHKQVVELILSCSPKMAVLDVGCAMGFIVKRLREKGVDAYGVDISNYAISRAPEEVKPYLKVASAHDLPFPAKSFDLIYCASVLEHIPESLTDKVIAEFQRVANRAILGIAYKDPYSMLDVHSDISHVNIKSETWWREKLPQSFEMIDVCVEDGKSYTRGLIKLNLGCFGDFYPSWINLDILPLRSSLPLHIRFKQWDLRQGMPFAENSNDLIRCSHLIEHLTLEEAKNLLGEFYRTLKPGGLARISTPDIHIIIKHYTNRDMSFFNQIQPAEYIQAPTQAEKLSRLLFSGDYQHKAAYDWDMLRNFLTQAGFETGKIHRVSPDFSYSEVMKAETQDQHIEVSFIMEVLK